MWWKKRTRASSKPLVAGRDRPAKSGARPLYSYYNSARQSQTPREQGRGRESLVMDEPRQAPQSPLYTAMLIVCVVIAFVCAIKILALSADGKIVVAENQQSLQLPTDVYAHVVQTSLKSSILNTNKITLSTKGVARDLQTKFPELSSVVVTVPLVGNRPIVYVKPSQASFILESSSGLFTLADTGYILAKLPAPQKGLTVIAEPGRRQPTIGKQFLPASTVLFAKVVVYQMNQAGLPVTRLELPGNAPYELQVRLAGKPYYLRFNLQADAFQQSGGAVVAIRTLTATQPREYIDLRVLGRAYYK